jgi:WD40 repeat protein
VKVWDARTGNSFLQLKDKGEISSVAVSPDGTHIVSGNYYDSTAKVWDARTGKPLLDLNGHLLTVTSVAFSPDGTRIVTGSADKTAKVWDARTGTPLLELKGHTDEVTTVAFSRDGSRIVTGSKDGITKVWDARSGTEPNAEELAFRRLHTRPNVERYRQGYRVAREAGHDFAARFYLNLLEKQADPNWETIPPPRREK